MAITCSTATTPSGGTRRANWFRLPSPLQLYVLAER
jgi:hypothetical protein